IKVLAPIIKAQKGEHRKVIDGLIKDGFVRLMVDGYEYSSEEEIKLEKNKKHDISAVVDRLVIKTDIRSRLAESLELAFEMSEGIVKILKLGVEGKDEEMIFSRDFACPECGFSLPELSPRMFSFNSPFGACPECDGLGEKKEIDPDLVLDRDKSLEEGAIIPWSGYFHSYYRQLVAGMAKKYKIPIDKPLKDLNAKQIETILYGNGGERFKIEYTNSYGEERDFNSAFEGAINNLSRRYAETRSDASREDLEKYMTSSPCQRCQGKRLREEILWVLLGGKSIAEVSAFSIRESLEFFAALQLDERDMIIARQVIKEINARLGFLLDVGLDYLTLDRMAGSLSGGEAQRIRLATQVGSSLMGVLYVLDEPSIGLHPRDNDRLLATLKRLRDLGNTVIVVEHDEETMQNADYIVDIGPGAGVHGGEVVAAGSLDDIMHSEDSLTGQYLSGQRNIAVPK
ncbi:MAG: Excinuclease subunit, partial [Firmicutes bacterium]|nr:Excinuclease subunit [Bacillota bacterium]